MSYQAQVPVFAIAAGVALAISITLLLFGSYGPAAVCLGVTLIASMRVFGAHQRSKTCRSTT